MQSRGLIGAVFGPHDAKECEFQVIRVASEDVVDLLELVVAQPEGSVKARGGIHAIKLPAPRRCSGSS
jgi:hypothetical protein